MNYKEIYDNIIRKAQLENRIKGKEIYYEKHHIIPKCLKGNNEKSNLVLLTAKEHFICHKLLTKIYPSNPKIIYAFWRLCSCLKKSSRDYLNAKELVSINCQGKNHPLYGKSPSIETRIKISSSMKNIKFSDDHKIKLRKPKHTIESKRKIWETRIKNGNEKISEESKEKMRIAKIGIPLSEETKRKMSQSRMGDKNPNSQLNRLKRKQEYESS